MTLEELKTKLLKVVEGDETFSDEDLNFINENIDQLDELSRATVKAYFNKSADDLASRSYSVGKKRKSTDSDNKIANREQGLVRAAERLPKRGMYKKSADKLKENLDLSEEEILDLIENIDQLDELSKEKLNSYIQSAVPSLISRSKKAGREGMNGVDKRLTSVKLAGDKLTRRGKYKKAVNESEASETLVPGGAPGDTKTELLAQILALTPHMTIEDLTAYYNKGLEMFKGAIDSISDDSAKNKASVAMKEDVAKIFEGEELSDEFKSKTATLFEAAVSLKVTEAIASLEEAYENALNEELIEIQDELVEKMDIYLEYAANEFINENQIAIESTLRNEISEDFINGLKNLFTEHYMELPEDKVDVIEMMTSKVEALEDSLNEALLINSELSEALEESVKYSAIEEAKEGLTITQAASFEKLAEGLNFDNIEVFTEKLNHLKEAYFNKPSNTSNILNEEFEDNKEKIAYVDPMIKGYIEAISRTVKK